MSACRRGAWIGLPLLALNVGCSIAPKNFRGLFSTAPIVRARSVGLGDHLSEARVIPALIERLADSDPVVRLSANEELKRRTGQDFGFIPWADPAERTRAVDHWRTWWNQHQGGLARSRPRP